MAGLRSALSHSVFTYWETPASALPVDWPDARERLAVQERADADGGSSSV
ncbi:MAG: hypothetical protein JF621_18685 [Streptomyces turgidiscabies]|nr:hypothetical protein [Streptomyces turgidiscabies]